MGTKSKGQPCISEFFKKKETKEDGDQKRQKPSSQNTESKNQNLKAFEHGSSIQNVKKSSTTPLQEKHKINDDEEQLQTHRSKRPKQQNGNSVSGNSKSKPDTRKLTPLEKQFLELKANNKDKVLAIQVGYKYKFFCEDAVIASKVLNIVLVPGANNSCDTSSDRFAYCSIPDNRLHIHLRRLLSYGLKVGVVKQMETASIKSVESDNKSGLFVREMTGVYTKATYLGDEDPPRNQNDISMNEDDEGVGDYIVCIDASDKKVGIVAVQPATGDIIYDTFDDDLARNELETRLIFLNPSEIIIIGDEEADIGLKKMVNVITKSGNVINKKRKPESYYRSLINTFFSKSEDTGQYYLLKFASNILSCISELLEYLQEFKLSNMFLIKDNMSSFSNSKKYMHLPGSTLQALEVFQNSTDYSTKGTLFWLLDYTKTKMGKRLLKKWVAMPLVLRDLIQDRLDAIDDLSCGYNNFIDSLKNKIIKLSRAGLDLEKSLIKVHYSSSHNVQKIDKKEIYLLLLNLDEISSLFRSFSSQIALFKDSVTSRLLADILQDVLDISESTTVEKLLKYITPSALDNNHFEQKVYFFNLQNYPDEGILSELEKIKDIEKKLDEELEKIRVQLNRPHLNYVTNLKDAYLIEVRNGKMINDIPSDWVKINGTKTVSRFRSPEVTRLYKDLQYHNDTLLRNCDIAYGRFLKEVDENYASLKTLSDVIARFDCLFSLCDLSSSHGYSMPSLTDSFLSIMIEKGRHPIIEKLGSSSQGYIANDIHMSKDNNRVLIITGPNMGGKSSYVKQVALLILMVQIGCYIPCDKATIGIFDSIFVRMGAKDDILRNKSTFMTELQECSNIIRSMTSRSLVILDELGRGTGTNDGIAIAFSVLAYLIENPAKPLTLFITHFPSLHVFEQNYIGIVSNYHMGYVENYKKDQEFPEILFLYNLVKGVVSKLYGLNVANLAGIPNSIVRYAFQKAEDMRKEKEELNLLKIILKLKVVPQQAHDESKAQLEEIFDSIQ